LFYYLLFLYSCHCFIIYYFCIPAIDPEGILCQARDAQSWHGTRSNKAVTGKGRLDYHGEMKLF
jgi:hypothetical protein